MPHYAWSKIQAGTAEKPVVYERGEQVTKAELKVSDADWTELLNSGAVREKKFPAPKGYTGSAVDFIREQLAEATSMSSVDEEEAASELAQVSEGSSHVIQGGDKK